MLLDVLPSGDLDYRIAEEISSTPDAKEWKLKIRQGVEFHNGRTLTADDVVATLKRHTDGKSQSGALGIVQGISEMIVEGDMVTLKLASGNATCRSCWPVTSRKVIGLFLEQVRLQFVPVLHRLQGRPAAQG